MAVTVVVISQSDGNKPRTAAEVVKGYLEALARGDAQGALSYASDQPATKSFLTDDVLKKQIAKWPITNIRILNNDSNRVHVAVNFGDQTSDESFWLEQMGDKGWKLKEGAIKLKFLKSSNVKALSTLTLFGEPFDTNEETYVFPGWIDFGNSNVNITQKPPSYPLLLNELTIAGASSSLMMSYDLSDAGRAGVQAAVKSAAEACAKSVQLAPVNCPQGVRDRSLVDGTAQWTAPTDYTDIRLGFFDAETLTMRLYGDIDFQLTATSTSGPPKSGRVTAGVSATADLTKNPPAITFK
ncbi:DUF4878 domain-containing protein [Mycobacterium angelicum]|uniref:Uncharacterized protein n=1 Tax=Mycobacterium angelicum TaxID=470074 RepID=A0A1X0A349_MYCAN|nr:DUF4878 domain-containing protein [Mycobacterium angelicum]MCV7197278.1 DUF4878 domain-containing protein [Mycobacterium angelicum]ORA24288.1 hypothetical protein BST12_05810 [Mycobacterium angelicum]